VQPPGCTTEAPQKPFSRRGGIPERQKRAGSKHSSAPITSKCQSFLGVRSSNLARQPKAHKNNNALHLFKDGQLPPQKKAMGGYWEDFHVVAVPASR
jgi:hypothetical protein